MVYRTETEADLARAPDAEGTWCRARCACGAVIQAYGRSPREARDRVRTERQHHQEAHHEQG